MTRRLVVGVSGATGVVYAERLLRLLAPMPVETHLVVSRSARMTLRYESDLSPRDLESLADISYRPNDVGAAIASGSFETMGMLVVPCSVKTMSEIACGITPTLLPRAADVTLKERRRLVLMVRETPLHRNHLRTMSELAELGAVIAPPVPAFYNRPTSIAELVDHSVGRVLDLFGLESGAVRRWHQEQASTAPGAEAL
ncbi:UbiX family flavin prenyltransferase [Streptomyces iranensis]|uniref:UbiX family flavin prenyltransferase n=1 Tax=Streptomyces iranensis TaxID=576784 RepID=UPI0039B72511